MATDSRTIKWYNEHARQYADHVRNDHESIYHAYYEKPAMRRLMPDITNKQVLSIGCGSGEDAVYMARHGTRRSVGIDISEQLIAIAKASYQECEFFVMDAENLRFKDNEFDFLYSSLALHYLEDWIPALNEAYRVLRPGSFFLFSCHHPVDSALKVTQDDARGKITQLARIKHKQSGTVEIIGDYLSHRRLDGSSSFAVTTWHKPISKIVSDIRASGFQIEIIDEPAPSPELQDISKRTYETLQKIPKFLIFKLYKPVNS